MNVLVDLRIQRFRNSGMIYYAHIRKGREYDAPEYNGYFVTYPS